MGSIQHPPYWNLLRRFCGCLYEQSVCNNDSDSASFQGFHTTVDDIFVREPLDASFAEADFFDRLKKLLTGGFYPT